jgi:hypothetical protein
MIYSPWAIAWGLFGTETKFTKQEYKNMAGMKDFKPYFDDFIGPAVSFPTSANIASPWVYTITGAAPPTAQRNNDRKVLTLTSASQIQILGGGHGDALAFDVDDVQRVVMRARIGASTFTSGSILVFGLGSARNDTADDVAANAWFRMEGANSTTLVYVETDDAVRDNNDVSTGVTLGTTYKEFVIDFTGGKQDVKFYIDGQRVAASTTFDMSGYTAGLQPIVQLQKAANTNADVFEMDYIEIDGKRV